MPAISIRLEDAAGLVLADAVSAASDVPGFDNSSMDGYAVAGTIFLVRAPTPPSCCR